MSWLDVDVAAAGPPSFAMFLLDSAGGRGDAVLTGVASSCALLCPWEVFSISSSSKRQGPRVRIWGISSGVHIPFQKKPTGL